MTVASNSPWIILFSFIQKSLLPYRLSRSQGSVQAFDSVLLSRIYKILGAEQLSGLSESSFL